MRANKINQQIHKNIENNNSRQVINKNNIPIKKNVYSKRVISSKLNTKEDKSMQVTKKELNNDIKIRKNENKIITNKKIGNEHFKEANSMNIKGNNNQAEFKYSKKIHVAKNDIDKEKKIINKQKIDNKIRNKVNNNEIINRKKIAINKEKKKIDTPKNENEKELKEGNNDIIKEIKSKNEIKTNPLNIQKENIIHAQQDNTNEKNNEINNKINSQKNNQELAKRGLIGLLNIGEPYYMNATLQCFSNCSRFKCNLLKLYKELEINKDSKYILCK